MNQDEKFSVGKRLRSFNYAFAGIVCFFKTEHNAWIHLLATMAIIGLATVVKVSNLEAMALVFAIGLVWMAEMFNTCIEKIMDFISMDHHPQIKLIKDISSGAVLIAALLALIVGLLIFIPKWL